MASELTEIILAIEAHHRNNPTHGLYCACLDRYIGRIRAMTTMSRVGAQCRMDYILHMACKHRTFPTS